MSRLLCTLLLSLLALNVSAQSLNATVDRTRLNAGESVELTLESQDTTLFGKPELQPLYELFEVLGTRQTGLAEFRIAELGRDDDLLETVGEVADALLAEHPARVRGLIRRWIGEERKDYGGV